MEGLTLKKGDQERIFTQAGSVAVVAAGAPVDHGTWSSAPLAADAKRVNAIRYTFDGQEADPVPVRWSFDDSNQIVGTIADAAPFAFTGQIKVDDNRDIAYELLDANGAPSGRTVTVLGDLSFNDADGTLQVTFEDGTPVATITGDSGLGSLSTSKNRFENFKGSDLLQFQASTVNTLSNGDVIISPADIQWVGNWDLQANRLVFAAELKNVGAGGAPTVNIVLAGKTKAVAGGLAYFAGPEGRQLALQISGQHQWDGGKGEWSTSIGFTEKKLTAKLSGGVDIERKDGEHFGLKGNLAFAQEAGAPPSTLEMDIAAYYQMGPNGIKFSANVTGTPDGRFDYNLGLEGQFVYDGVRLTFNIQFTRDGSGDKLVIELAARKDGDNSALRAALKIVMNADDPSHVNLDLKL